MRLGALRDRIHLRLCTVAAAAAAGKPSEAGGSRGRYVRFLERVRPASLV